VPLQIFVGLFGKSGDWQYNNNKKIDGFALFADSAGVHPEL
jgi:hypothetical protein